jgi:hypothetical protein
MKPASSTRQIKTHARLSGIKLAALKPKLDDRSTTRPSKKVPYAVPSLTKRIEDHEISHTKAGGEMHFV